MAQFQLSGEIVLRDMFSGTLDDFNSEVSEAVQNASQLGDELDTWRTPPGLLQLQDQVGTLQERAAQLRGGLDKMTDPLENMTADDRVRELTGQIAALQAKARTGVKLNLGEVAQYQQLNSELHSIQGNLDGIAGKSKGASMGMTFLVQALAGFGITFGVQQLMQGVLQLTQLGAKAEEAASAYDSLTRAAGINGDALLASIHKASGGTISELDAMLFANRALLSEQDALVAGLPTIVNYARGVADAIGTSTLEATERITQSLATMQPRGLKEFGIILSPADALAAAAAMGEEVSEMERMEKQARFVSAAMEIMAQKQGLLGEQSMSAADQMESAGSAWADVKAEIGKGINESGFPKVMADWAASSKLATDQRHAIEELSADTHALVDALAETGRVDQATIRLKALSLWLADRGFMGADGVADLNAELRTMVYGPAGYLPMFMTNAGIAMDKVANTSPGQLPYWVGQLRDMSGAADETSGAMLTLEGAILQAVGATRALASTKFKGSGLTSAISQVEGRLTGLAGLVDKATLQNWQTKAVGDLETMFRTMGNTTEFGVNLMVQEYLGGWDRVTTGVRTAQNKIEKSQEEHVDRLFDNAGSLRSAIEGALSQGLEVTDIDLRLTAEGKYEDKVKESARQLQAIAERGFSELQAHPDWADALKIPGDVLSGTEAQLKAWATATGQDVKDNIRPDLINWDAFVANFQGQLEDKAAQDLTIDIAVEKLKDAGLLDQSTEELRDQIAAQLGLKVPELSIETMFQTKEGAGADLVQQITGGLPALPVPVEAILSAANPQDKKADEIGSGITVTAAANVQTNTTAAQDSGSALATATVTGFSATIAAADVGAVTLTAWQASFTAQEDGFESIGVSLGHIIAAAFRTAVLDDVDGFQTEIAGVIAPEVERVIRRRNSGRGANE